MTSTVDPPAVTQSADELLDSIEELHARHDDGDPGSVFEFIADLEQLLRANGRPQFGTPWPDRALGSITAAHLDAIEADAAPAKEDDHEI